MAAWGLQTWPGFTASKPPKKQHQKKNTKKERDGGKTPRQGVGVTIGHYPIEQHPNGRIKPSQKSPQYRQGVGVTIGNYQIEQHPNGHIKPSQKILYKKKGWR